MDIHIFCVLRVDLTFNRAINANLFLLAIILFVLLRITAFDYPFGIFKLFLKLSSKR